MFNEALMLITNFTGLSPHHPPLYYLLTYCDSFFLFLFSRTNSVLLFYIFFSNVLVYCFDICYFLLAAILTYFLLFIVKYFLQSFLTVHFCQWWLRIFFPQLINIEIMVKDDNITFDNFLLFQHKWKNTIRYDIIIFFLISKFISFGKYTISVF